QRALERGGAADPESTAQFTPIQPSVTAPATAQMPPSAAPASEPRVPQMPPPGAPDSGIPSPPRRRRLLPWLLVLLAVVAGAAGAYLLLRPEQKRVPLVVGQTLDSARQKLSAAGFKVDIDRRADASPVDTVFRQVPSQGDE